LTALLTVAPPGYLLCDGSEVSRTTYSDLFAVIGVYFGVGDNSTTFNLPNITDSNNSGLIYIIKF
jgi:microcystin-dependent protein